MASKSEGIDHVLDVSERLFLERGYAGTRLRDIAGGLGIHHASLYYHAPGGKEELWRRVIERALGRHHAGLTEAATRAGPDLRAQLVAMALWLVSQPAMNVVALASSDLPASPQPQARDTFEQIYANVMTPVRDVFQAAADRGEIGDRPPDLLTGMFVSSMNALPTADHAGMLPIPTAILAEMVVDVILDGSRAT